MPVKSIRLSKQIRTDIKSAMIESWIKHNPAPCDIDQLRKKTGDILYEMSYPKLNVEGIPKDMLNTSHDIKIVIDGVVQCFSMTCSRPTRGDRYRQIPNKHFKSTPRVIKDYEQAKHEYDAWIRTKNAFEEEITQILESVSTTKQLAELWPEAENYLPPYASDPSKGIKLPALKTSRLNASLGIKK